MKNSSSPVKKMMIASIFVISLVSSGLPASASTVTPRTSPTMIMLAKAHGKSLHHTNRAERAARAAEARRMLFRNQGTSL